jgi:hypothetical protein
VEDPLIGTAAERVSPNISARSNGMIFSRSDLVATLSTCVRVPVRVACVLGSDVRASVPENLLTTSAPDPHSGTRNAPVIIQSGLVTDALTAHSG